MGTKSFEVEVQANTAVVTTAETVIATLSGVSTPRRTNVRLTGWCQFTTGADTTALTLRVRRGTTVTDTLVDEGNPVQLAAAAGSTEEISITVKDENVDLANGVYVLTIEATAASANGSVLQAALTATMPD